MTVSTTTSKVSYSGNGSTTVFAYTFKVFDEDDLTVILRDDTTGTETVQTITTDYTVSGVGNTGGGNVTFVTAPASGKTVVIRRESAQTQTTDYTPNDPFPAEAHEDALDKLTFIAQEVQEELDRAIKISRTNTMTSTEFTVGATARANKVLAFDSNGEIAVTQEIGTFVGNWSASTAYNQRDIVKDTSTNNIFIANTAHTSSGSQPLTTNTDSAKWDLLVDAASATTSATAAAASAAAAATSATSSATSATSSASSASTATTQASNASASATAAAASAAAAAASADTFDDTYLGAKSSDPTVDNDGDPLNAGDLYFNTTSNTLKVYNGSAWNDAALASADFVQITGDTMTGNLGVQGTITVGDSHTIGDDADDNLELASSASENIVIDSAGGTTAFKENGTEVARLTGGSLGIGTSSPSASHKLTLDHTSNYGGISLKQTGTQVGQIIQEGGTGNIYVDADSAGVGGNLILRTNGGSERMRIDSSGNVGIGSTSPQGVLDLGDGTGGKGIVWGGPTGTQHYGSIWSEYGTASIVIGAGLKGSTSSSDFIFPYTGTYSYSAIELDSFSSDGIKFYTTGSASRTSGASATKTERMRIDSSGNLYFGADGSTYNTAFLRLYGRDSLSTSQRIDMGKTFSGNVVGVGFYHAGSAVGSIDYSNTGVAYNTSSDYRLKENVTDMTGATERLKQLNPVRFNFIADADTTVDGFLAHEVQDVVPEAITGTKDAMRDEEYEVTPAVLDDEGNEITPAVMGTRSVPDYQGIDQSKLVPLLVATIQELEARIAALEAN